MNKISVLLLVSLLLASSLISINFSSHPTVRAQPTLRVHMGTLTMPQGETGTCGFMISNIGTDTVYSVQAEIVDPGDMIVIGNWVVLLGDIAPNQDKEAIFTVRSPPYAYIGDHTMFFKLTYEKPKGTIETWKGLEGTVRITAPPTAQTDQDYGRTSKTTSYDFRMVYFLAAVVAVIVGLIWGIRSSKGKPTRYEEAKSLS